MIESEKAFVFIESLTKMETCKYCGGKHLRKDGVRNGAQKWRCKECNRSQGEIDKRCKYSEKEKTVAEVLYLEGCGFRRIARILSAIFNKVFRWQTVVKWIKKAALEIEKGENLKRIQGSYQISLVI
jgi:transposase-like protein